MDLTKVRIGACQVFYKSRDLGHTLGGVELSLDREFKDINVDKYGTTAVDKALTGQNFKAKVTLAQPDFYNLDVAMPESSAFDGAGGLDRVNIGTDAGFLLRGEGGLLVLHPLNKAVSDFSEDINIYIAVSVETVEMAYKVDEQRVLAITFQALVSESYDSGRRLGHIGPAAVS